MNPLKKRQVPMWLWAAFAAALVVLLMPLGRSGDDVEVHIVGAGGLDLVTKSDAPEGYRYRLNTKSAERPEQTAGRVERVLQRWPHIVVIGFDPASVSQEPSGVAVAKTSVEKILSKAVASESKVYVLGFIPQPTASTEVIATSKQMNTWLRDSFCRRNAGCIPTAVEGMDAAGLRAYLSTAMVNAITNVTATPPMPALPTQETPSEAGDTIPSS